MDEPQFLVQWEEHPTHLASRLGYLLEHQSLVDVTLMCNTHTLRVHRAVLAACSPYFERQLGNHPLIVLKDMKFSVLKSLVEFMYCGETSVSEENLSPLLEAAKFFQVKGLASMTKESVFSNGSGTKVNGTSHFSPNHTPVNNGIRGGRGRGRGRGGRTPISPKVGSPTESAQILLSLSGGAAAPQFMTTSRNVKIDTSLLEARQSKVTAESVPRRRGRRRIPASTPIRDRFFKSEPNTGDENSPLLSSLLGKEAGESETAKGLENSTYTDTLKELGLPTNVPIMYDNGQGKVVKLTEDILRSVITSEGSVQFQVAESPASAPTTSSKLLTPGSSDKENKNFLVKEMAVQNKTTNGEVMEMPKVIVKPAMEESVSEQFNDNTLETLKSGVAAEAESEPDAVVLYEICDNKKLHKCVLSAKDIQSVKELNEQLSKQKKQLADMTKDNISTLDPGNTNVAELKLKIRKTTSVLSQIVEKVKGFKSMKDFKTVAMELKENPHSQVVQLEFVNGKGEKIEGYQVEGTVVEKRRREESGERTEFMGLLDMVCEGGEGLLEKEKQELEAMGQDVLLEATSDEASDYLMSQEESGLPYDHIEDMIHHSPADEKQHLKYIIDTDVSIINTDDNYVVYKEDASNEYVIYDSTEPVLPITDPDFHDRTDTNSDYITPDKRLPMEVSNSPADTQYIIYDDNKSPPNFEDSHKPQFVFNKTERSVERLLDKDRVPSVNFNSFEDKFETYSEEHCDRTSETSSSGECISGKRRTSIASDSSDNSSKKQKLQTSLVDDDNDSL